MTTRTTNPIISLSSLLLLFLPQSISFQPPLTIHNHHHPTTLHLSSSSPSSSPKYTSSSDQERRNEEQRRLQRKNDVIIGKTSAIPSETNYKIDPKVTENDFFANADSIEQEVYIQTERGLDCLRMLHLEEAREAFDKVYTLKPNAYLWQAGIVLFYLNEVHAAAECFAKNAVLYEAKFGEQATEERIWRDACELKLMSMLSKKERKIVKETKSGLMVPNIPVWGGRHGETRKVIRLARDLFSSSVQNDLPTTILSRAKLRLIGGNPQTKRRDPKLWKLTSWYYLGLYYDAVGDVDASKQCMKNALKLTTGGMYSNDVTQCLPVIHMSRRDWYDDDEFVLEEEEEDGVEEDVGGHLEQMIRDGVNKMKLVELKEGLKMRKCKSSGAKSVLQERMIRSLLEECGLSSFGSGSFQ